MPTYFRKTIRLLPGVTLNLNKTGASLSIGPRGAKINISKKGVYFNSSIPGTGVYNKTKIGTSLLWGLGTAAATVAAGYGLGVALQNYQLFLVFLIAAIPLGIIAFFVSKAKAKVVVGSDADDLDAPDDTEAPRTTSRSKKTAQRTATRQKSDTGPKRTANASAKAYVGAVEMLVEQMAAAQTLEQLNKAHEEILDIMYTNIKPLGVEVFGLPFKEALAAIEQDYATGLRQISEATNETTSEADAAQK